MSVLAQNSVVGKAECFHYGRIHVAVIWSVERITRHARVLGWPISRRKSWDRLRYVRGRGCEIYAAPLSGKFLLAALLSRGLGPDLKASLLVSFPAPPR